MSDEQITKRRVTMANAIVTPGGEMYKQEAVDYVRPDFLDVYVEDAKTRWQVVTVSDEPDAGPAGYHGATHVPEHLDHPLAGQTFAATTPEGLA
jgi:hypothetical protein